MSDVFSQLFSNNSEQIKLGEFPAGDYCFGVFSNGLFEKENVPFVGEFTTLKTPFNVPSLPAGANSFSPGFISIPAGVLVETINFYRKVMKTIKSEVMTMIVYDTVLGQYKIVVPVQVVSGATVSYEQVQFEEHEKYIMSCHSHVDMSAFFSGTDNADEKKAMLYGVIGKLSQETPEMKFRAKKGNIASELPVEYVFDFKDKRKFTIPETEILKISQRAVHVVYQNPQQAWNYRVSNKPATVYDYRQRKNLDDVIDLLDEEHYMYQNPGWYGYGSAEEVRGNKKPKSHNDLEFLDPDVSLAIDAFRRVYIDYAERNFSMELTEDDKADYFVEIANKLCTLIDSLDVEEDFHEIFAELYLEGTEGFPLMEEDDETLEEDTVKPPMSLLEFSQTLM